MALRTTIKSLALFFTLPVLFAASMTAHAQQSGRDKLAAHTQEFRKDLIEVTDGVYVAVGYALANSILIEGDDGVIIVDTTESQTAAREVKALFDTVTSKPVKAIIYTHNHTDHISGARIFAGDDNPEIYSHETTMQYVSRIYNLILPIIFARSARQFGTLLPEDQLLNDGIGPRLRLDGAIGAGFIPPTKTFADTMDIEVAGVKMTLVHAPGETDDQLFVWLPDKKTLLPGDNFYKAFPNLYAIRGTKYRDVRKWADSLDKMLQYDIEHLVPSHTRPISGKARIRSLLTDYRDAIRFVHDETIAGINKGLTPEQLVESVKLPSRLAENPYLAEYYGTVAWSVRNIYTGYLGWFDGNATNLFPMSTRDRAERIAELAGGAEVLLERLRKAVEAGDHQWAAELADLVIALDPDAAEPKLREADALAALGEKQISANGRNYYLTRAQQLRRVAK